MKFHIVRNGETIEDIVFLYGLEADELKKENKHIRSWDNIIPGTKLRIPAIPEAVELDVISMEPFIEDYYPKLKLGEELQAESQAEPQEEYNYQEIDNYVIKSTENKNIQNQEDLQKEETPAEIKTEPKVEKIPVEIKAKPTEEEDDEEEDVVIPIQPIYYPYYPYYYYNRYPYPKLVYPVYVYPGRSY